MKKIFILISMLILFSCENKQDIENDIERLKLERNALKENISAMMDTSERGIQRLEKINEELKEKEICKSGRTPKYILTLNLSVSHMTLDLETHFKDAMNSAEFSLAVDKDLYDGVSIGDNIVNKFREGSFLFGGSIGSWKVKVTRKEIK